MLAYGQIEQATAMKVVENPLLMQLKARSSECMAAGMQVLVLASRVMHDNSCKLSGPCCCRGCRLWTDP